MGVLGDHKMHKEARVPIRKRATKATRPEHGSRPGATNSGDETGRIKHIRPHSSSITRLCQESRASQDAPTSCERYH